VRREWGDVARWPGLFALVAFPAAAQRSAAEAQARQQAEAARQWRAEQARRQQAQQQRQR